MMTLHSWQIELYRTHDPPLHHPPNCSILGETEKIFKTLQQIQNEKYKHLMGKFNGV